MSFKKPKLPEMTPSPSPQQAPMMQGGAGANVALSSTFRKFRFAPALAGFSPKTAGRRSLLGGDSGGQ